jgi:hypothetical protein
LVVDESGDNWNYANLDSLLGGSGGGGGGDGIYGGSGSLPGNVLVTGGANNFTLGTTSNVTLGDYPNDSYLRTVGGTNQIDIKGSGGTTINGIAYHTEDAQTGGKPAGTYLTTHNETGGNVSWLNTDSLLNLNGFFSSENQNGLMLVDTALFTDNLVFRRIDTTGFDFNTYNVIEMNILSKFLGPSNYEGGFKVLNQTVDGDYSKLEMYATHRNIGVPEGLLQYNSSIAGAEFNIHSLIGPIIISPNDSYDLILKHPSSGRISLSDSSLVYNANGSTTTGLLGIDASGNVEEFRADGQNGKILVSDGNVWAISDPSGIAVTDSLFIGVDDSWQFVDQNNSVNDSLNFTSFLAEVAQDGNGLFDPSNQASTVAIDTAILNSDFVFRANNSGTNTIELSSEFAGTTASKLLLTAKGSANNSELYVQTNGSNSSFYGGDARIQFTNIVQSGHTLTLGSTGDIDIDADRDIRITGPNLIEIGFPYSDRVILYDPPDGNLLFGATNHIADYNPIESDSSFLMIISSESSEEARLRKIPSQGNDGNILISEGDTWGLINSESLLSENLDSLFLVLGNEAPTYINQTDGISDTINIADSLADSRVQYATSYMTGGNNGDIDTGTPEPLNLTTNGTIDTVIASTDFSVLSDGSIKFLGTTAFVTIDANVSTDIVGGAAEAVFYLTVNGVVQTSSRATVEIRGAYANANITYSASLAQNDTINIVGNADVNNAIFNVDDWRLRVVKLR